MPDKTAVKYVVKKSREFYANAVLMRCLSFALFSPANGGVRCRRGSRSVSRAPLNALCVGICSSQLLRCGGNCVGSRDRRGYIKAEHRERQPQMARPRSLPRHSKLRSLCSNPDFDLSAKDVKPGNCLPLRGAIYRVPRDAISGFGFPDRDIPNTLGDPPDELLNARAP